MDSAKPVERRTLICSGLSAAGFILIAGTARPLKSLRHFMDVDSRPLVKFGLITDLHYADKPPAGTRHYRECLSKLDDIKQAMEEFQPDFIVELGDLVDAAESVDEELAYLKTVNDRFKQLPGDKHYVLGNHCVHTLTKTEFLNGVAKERSHYSFDQGGIHFVVLDACFRSDGVAYERANFEWTDPNIPAAQAKWLENDLERTDKRTIVFVHQRLDEKPPYSVKNAKAIRSILEQSGNVVAVFQGHSHQNDHQVVSGIHYCTLVAMVEGAGLDNNGAAKVEVFEDGSIRVTGIRKQKNYQW